MDLYDYRFAAYELDKAEQLLLREGQPVPLTPKAFAILLMLIERSGHVVSKTDLMQAVWGDVCVEEANLTQNIFILRRILGEGVDGKKYIETVPRRGYRFVSPVSRILRSETQPRSEDEQKKSIAVLPFADGNLDGTFEYLADGIAESIINSLSELPQLRVMAWSAVSRYKGKDKDPREIGAELGVPNLLSGRLRTVDKKLIISVELVDVRGGWRVWGETFTCDATGLFVVQPQISKQISDALKLKLTVDERERLEKRYTENSGAYLHYLKGRYHWAKYTKHGLETAIKCYRSAIELDPTYALAHVGIADAYFRLSTTFLPPLKALPLAKAAAKTALEIDDDLAEAHASLGKVCLNLREFQVAEAEIRRALELKEGYALAHLWYGTIHEQRCNLNEALRQKKLALKLDPLSLLTSVSLATTLWSMGDFEAAERQLFEALEIDENFQTAYIVLALIQEQRKDYTLAIHTFEKAIQMGETSFLASFLARVYALFGNNERAHALINESIAQAQTRHISPYSLALAFAGSGDLVSAFLWFEKAYEEYDEWLAFIKQDLRLDGLRDDPRLVSLVNRVGLL